MGRPEAVRGILGKIWIQISHRGGEENEEIYIPSKSLHADLGRGLGGKITGEIARIDQLEIGEFIFKDLIASFPDPESYPDTIAFTNRNGTLGGEILTRFDVVFDYYHSAIYLKKTNGYKRPFEFNMSGLTVSATGKELNSYSVEIVREGSPAERVDIREGDIINSINGFEDKDLDLNEVYQLFNSKEGKKVRLGISRDGEILKKSFKLERIL